jgi:hypothetical protein
MSQLTGDQFASVLREENISLPRSAGGKGVPLMGVGLLLAVGAIVLGMMKAAGATFAHGLAAYHVGAMAVLAASLGATFIVMIFHLFNAGWTGTVRRQFENLMSFLPFAAILAFVTPIIDFFVGGGQLFLWMSPEASHDLLLQEKWIYFFGSSFNSTMEGHKNFPLFFFARGVFYIAFWFFVSRRLYSWSLQQDQTGDPTLTSKARFQSAWGILVLALTTAFCAFDWLKSLDYRFFSTMWGVYYFAGGAFASTYLVTLIFAMLRGKGRLEGAVTKEHFHDLGKMAFSFTVFWAYIAFSQYFLIWYSNIPEETAYYNYRKSGEIGALSWNTVSTLVVWGHFAALFLFMISRHVKKNPKLVALAAIWALFMHAVDIFWIVRPMVYAGMPAGEIPGLASGIIDLAGLIGFAMIFAGYLMHKIPSAPLIAVRDPRLHEALEHKNYV